MKGNGHLHYLNFRIPEDGLELKELGEGDDEQCYSTWFYDLSGGKTEYVLTIACMIGKSRMKGEKVVTSLVPYGPEKPRSGMVKLASTNQVGFLKFHHEMKLQQLCFISGGNILGPTERRFHQICSPHR